MFLVAAAVLAATVLAWRFGLPLLSGTKQNVVLIVIDTARRDAFGCYGNPLKPTPNIDAVAADGVLFDQAISTSGWTLPAVASLFTGTWPTIHGGLGKNVSLKPIRDEIPTGAEVLKKAGLQTLGFANAAFVSPMIHLDRGFDVFDHQYTYNHDYRKADKTIDAVIPVLRKNRTKSNFIMVHLFDPHLHYNAPPPFRFKYTKGRTIPAPPLSLGSCLELESEDRSRPPVTEDIQYVRGMYMGEIGFVDFHLGRLMQQLKSLDMYDNTMLIIVADHGEEFWDHQKFEHGHTLYDELIRVPLIVKYPQDIKPVKKVVAAQVRIIDIMPTVFRWLGIEQPESFVGKSLTPLVLGETEAPRNSFSESTLYSFDKIAWRGSRYKYIIELDPDLTSAGELFDWQNDPGETTNLAGSMPEVAKAMHDELFDFYAGLASRATRMSQPKQVNLSPVRIKMLRSLGYIR